MIKTYKNLDKILFYMIFVMLVAVLTSVVILRNKELLIYFYSVAFIIQIIILSLTIFRDKILIDKNSLVLICLYFCIMAAPCICNFILGITSNYYDYFNVLFKVFYFFVFFCVFKKVRISDIQLKSFMKYIVIIGVISCLYNFIFCFDEIAKIITATSSYQVNVKSFFTNRNDFGGFLSLSMIATFFYYGDTYTKKESVFRMGILVLFAFNIFITFSRGAIFSSLIIVSYMIYEKYKNKPKIIIIIALLIIMIIYILSNNSVTHFLEALVIRSDNFDSNRFTLWRYGLNIININPFFGVGYYTGVEIAIANNFPNTQFHNFFIDNTVGTGIIGTTFVFGIVLFCLVRCLNRCGFHYYKRIYFIAFITLLAKMLIESVSFFSLGYSDNVTSIFYVALPLLLSNMETEPSYE